MLIILALKFLKADLESMTAERDYSEKALRAAKQEAAGLRWNVDELRAYTAVSQQNVHDLQERLAAMQLDMASTTERAQQLQDQVYLNFRNMIFDGVPVHSRG